MPCSGTSEHEKKLKIQTIQGSDGLRDDRRDNARMSVGAGVEEFFEEKSVSRANDFFFLLVVYEFVQQE